MPVRRLRPLGLVGAVVLMTGVAAAVATELAGGSRPGLSADDTHQVPLSSAGPSAPTAAGSGSPTAAPATTSALPTATATPTPTPPAVAPSTASGSKARPKPTPSPKNTPPAWLTTPSGPKPVTGVLLSWDITSEMSLTSYSDDRACFAVPVILDDVQGGSVDSISLDLTWPMPPGENGPITASSGTVPVSVGNGTSITVNVPVCLEPILAQPTPSGRSQMVARLTYSGDLANGATSQNAGTDEFFY